VLTGGWLIMVVALCSAEIALQRALGQQASCTRSIRALEEASVNLGVSPP